MKVRNFFFLLIITLMWSCNKGPKTAIIETEFGDMKIELYDSTPLHRDNFIKLVNAGFYDDLLFHRVIKGFMIQGGDPNSKGAAPGVSLGAGGPGYQIPAEIGSPHFKGVLAAARTGDGQNPEKKSSGSQFYIVQGAPQEGMILDNIATNKNIKYNDTQRKRYMELGGTPQLDMDYTAFGEVIEGLDVIDKIADVETAPGARPMKDIKMKIRMLN